MTGRRTSAAELAAVATALLDEHGPAAVTMREVASRAGVSTMATYRHFADRDELMRAVVDRAFAELAGDFDQPRPATPEKALTAMAATFVDLALRRPHLFALMFTDHRPDARVLPDGAERSPTLRLVIAALRQGVADGTFADDDMVEVAVTAAAMIQGLCLARHAGRIGGTDDEFRALVGRSAERILNGLRN